MLFMHKKNFWSVESSSRMPWACLIIFYCQVALKYTNIDDFGSHCGLEKR